MGPSSSSPPSPHDTEAGAVEPEGLSVGNPASSDKDQDKTIRKSQEDGVEEIGTARDGGETSAIDSSKTEKTKGSCGGDSKGTSSLDEDTSLFAGADWSHEAEGQNKELSPGEKGSFDSSKVEVSKRPECVTAKKGGKTKSLFGDDEGSSEDDFFIRRPPPLPPAKPKKKNNNYILDELFDSDSSDDDLFSQPKAKKNLPQQLTEAVDSTMGEAQSVLSDLILESSPAEGMEAGKAEEGTSCPLGMQEEFDGVGSREEVRVVQKESDPGSDSKEAFCDPFMVQTDIDEAPKLPKIEVAKSTTVAETGERKMDESDADQDKQEEKKPGRTGSEREKPRGVARTSPLMNFAFQAELAKKLSGGKSPLTSPPERPASVFRKAPSQPEQSTLAQKSTSGQGEDRAVGGSALRSSLEGFLRSGDLGAIPKSKPCERPPSGKGYGEVLERQPLLESITRSRVKSGPRRRPPSRMFRLSSSSSKGEEYYYEIGREFSEDASVGKAEDTDMERADSKDPTTHLEEKATADPKSEVEDSGKLGLEESSPEYQTPTKIA